MINDFFRRFKILFHRGKFWGFEEDIFNLKKIVALLPKL
jgi:hypothetical protein